jgi:hypothetical protein
LETLSQRFENGLVARSLFDQAQASSVEQMSDLHAELAGLRAETSQLRAELEQRLEDIRASTSWRVTAPLRRASQLVRSAKSGLSGNGVRERLRPLASSAALAIHKRPLMRKSMVRAIRAVPGLEARLRSTLAGGASNQDGWQRRHVPSQLTPRGQAVRDKLKTLQGQ